MKPECPIARRALKQGAGTTTSCTYRRGNTPAVAEPVRAFGSLSLASLKPLHGSLGRAIAVCSCLLFVASASAADHVESRSALYAKHDTLQQTMLSTRDRLRSWQGSQDQAREAIKIGNWYSTQLGAPESPDAAAITPGEIDHNDVNQGKSRWKRCPADQAGNPSPPGSRADWLFTTITASRPVTLTLELSRHERFGGFAYRPPPCGAGAEASESLVWLNGQPVPLQNKLAGYENVPVAKRRGWHDAVLIDLKLKAGENRLVVSLRKGDRGSWFTAVRIASEPIPAIWAMIENDFPRSSNRLLDEIDAGWFEATTGWFARQESLDFERKFIDSVVGILGSDGAVLGDRCQELAETGVASSDPRWLDLCVTAAELKTALAATDALRNAVEELDAAYAGQYAGAELLTSVAALRQRLVEQAVGKLDPAEAQTRKLLEELASLKRDALVVRNPLLAGKKLVFVKRYTYDSDHYYDEFIAGIRRFGGGLYQLSLSDGAVTEIAPQLAHGLVDRYDLSFDAQRILFNYKPAEPAGFRIFEMAVDGGGLRQITFPPDDEEERIATYATCSRDELANSPGRYGHWTDDMHPCYLPDGRIVFTSTRSQRSVLCGGHGLTVANLYRINADGSGLVQLSQGALSEFCPTVMNDGRILYNRWEYVDKGAGAVQSLWATCPDGSRSEEIYGNNITTPAVFNQARHVPGRGNLVVCLGAGHCPGNMGAILLIDLHKNKRSEEAMTALTPGCVPKGNWALRQFRNGRWITDIYGPWYCDPYPLADNTADRLAGKFFLVSCNPDRMWNDPAGYGLYLLDVFGNRVPIYRDPEISCWQARPLEPRPIPPVLSPSTEEEPSAENATVLVTDVYQGLDGVPRGSVKYLRVMEQVPRPWSAYLGYQANDRAPGQMVAISLWTHLSVKVLHGVVAVHEDGSAHFRVPADRNIFLSALDENFMEIQRMRTFVNFQPGEQRSCIGCHEHRNQAPANLRPLALTRPPVDPQPQPGETAPRPLHYTSDIQPIFDRHCVSCHGGEKTEGDLDLSGEMTELFCRSYENIIRRDLVSYIQEFVGVKPEGADAMGYAPAVGPYTYGSHRSKLIEILRKDHYEVQLPREDFIKLVTWVDGNSPYYGSYFGRRNIAHRNDPDFRPVPTLSAAFGIAK